MIESPSPQTVPFAAWEQAVFVVLFIVFIGVVFALVRWLLNWSSSQQLKWQAFMKEQNTSWQNYIKEQRSEDNAKIEQVARQSEAGFRTLTDAIADLARALAALTGDVNEHIADESAMLNAMLSTREKARVRNEKVKTGDG